MKTCSDCGQTKPLDGFWNERARRDGKNPRCRSCAGKQHRGSRSYVRNRGGGRPEIYLVSKYGITTAELEAMKVHQDNLCAICGTDQKLVIDHDHATGRVRGLLCNTCNTGLGHIERQGFLEKATAYLDPMAAAA